MDRASIQRAAFKVHKDGILFHQPHRFYTFFDDFFGHVVNNSNEEGWIETVVGAGTAFSVKDERGGILLLTTDANDDDSGQIQWNNEIFKLVDDKRLWFEARVKISEKTQSDFLCGLCIKDTSVIAGVSDGVFFHKDDGSVNIECKTVKDTSNADDDDSGEDFADDTFVKLGIYWNGNGKVQYFVDGKLVVTHNTAANICQDEELTPTFAFMNGDANARTAELDYIKVMQER